VLVISRDPAGGDELASALLALTERRVPRTDFEDQVPAPWGPADDLPPAHAFVTAPENAGRRP
jgi:hypothetical protein